MLPKMTGVFSDDIAIDLGTANTLVHVVGRGIIIDEPSIVAARFAGGEREMVAVGAEARRIVGRTPEPLEAIRPLRDGVIADFVATEFMLRQFIRRARSVLGLRRPRILISVPAGATPVERRAVTETARYAGARAVQLIAEPVAALLGAGVPVEEAAGAMVVDIGGGTTDIAIVSFGELVAARSLRCAGNAMDEAIMRYVRRRHHLVIGEASAERIKIEAGTAAALANGLHADIHIRGRDLRRGRLKSVVLGPPHVAEALEGPIEEIAEFARRALEDVPAEIAAGICERGIELTGGGALLDRLDHELGRRLGVGFTLAPDPMRCVIKGTAMVLEGTAGSDHLLMASDL
ncbi:MAG: rod shape-determining protein [Hyphomicrobiaceae bacterium]|nr:rod shape-determining protein [Hyphomicrobiaceae bacterium]